MSDGPKYHIEQHEDGTAKVWLGDELVGRYNAEGYFPNLAIRPHRLDEQDHMLRRLNWRAKHGSVVIPDHVADLMRVRRGQVV